MGDIGTHWVDLTSFVIGMKPAAVLADLSTFIPERRRPVGPVETFSRVSGATEPVRIATEDAALILLRYPNGAWVADGEPGEPRAQELAGLGHLRGGASAAWHSEAPEQLWVGHRDEPNQVLTRDPGLMNARGAAAAVLPGGHVEGFADSFATFFRQVYADVAAGGRQASSTRASLEDGHYEMLFCEAVLQSAREGRWVDVG